MALRVITKPMVTLLRTEGKERTLFGVKPSRCCRCCKNIYEITLIFVILYHSRGRNFTTDMFILKSLNFMLLLSYKSLSGCIVIKKSGLNMGKKHVNKWSLLLILIYFMLFYFISAFAQDYVTTVQTYDSL